MMQVEATRIDLAAMRRPPQQLTESVVVGKDVLELFAGAMYADPLSVYREYVQNAADSLDQARRQGLTAHEVADITIAFDHKERTVTIRDYGAGVTQKEFIRKLTSIGASQKRGTSARGFRGIGRLSGLGYCQELVFRSRASGDPKVKEMRWDGRVLRERLRDASFTGDLGELIQEVAKVAELPGAEYPAHFFEVEMRKILRVRNDVLLNEELVRDYLSQVAPVPFRPDFALGVRIGEWLQERGIAAPIRVRLEDGLGLVYRKHSNQLQLAANAVDSFRDVRFVEYKNSDDELLSAGWVLDHAYAGGIPNKVGLGGIRLRHGNIQVGDANVLAPLFVETRFSQWVVAEFHVLHPRIVPNARRDDFEHTPAYVHLNEHIKDFAREQTETIRQRSDQRAKLKKVRMALQYHEGWFGKAKDQAKPVLAAAVAERAHQFLGDAQRALAKLKSAAAGREEAERLVSRATNDFNQWQRENKRRFKTVDPIQHAALSAILASSFRQDSAVQLASEVVSAMSKAKRAT